MERSLLDKIDFNILTTLARDCRTSNSSMGSIVGLTSKSVKARIKNMVCSGVIVINNIIWSSSGIFGWIYVFKRGFETGWIWA
jgi:DNA-binding Lrp family transcriptional regulator